MNVRPGDKPRFFWFALFAGALVASASVYETANIVRGSGSETKVIGWAAAPSARGWTIVRVDAGTPADGKVQRGDRLLAIDGDRRAEFADPDWRLLSMAPDRHYDVTVERDGSSLTIPLRFAVRPDGTFLLWAPAFLLISLTFLFTGLLIGLLRPGDVVGRYGFIVSILLSMFFLWVLSNPLSGMLHGIPLLVSLALSCVIPLHILFTYLFYAAFPEGRPETGGWRLVRNGVVVVGVALWIPATLVNLVHALGVERSSGIVYGHPGLFLWLRTYLVSEISAGPAQLLYFAGVCLASLAVGWRNYRRLPEGDLRRRLRWVAWGALSAMVPSVIAQLVIAQIQARGLAEEEVQLIGTITRIANGLVVIMPITTAYAILKRRVVGFETALHAGVQYLLAANVLRAILFLPMAGLAVVFALNPNRTLGQLLFQGSGRFNLILIGLAGLSLRFRAPLRNAIDRRFFRDAYDREQILVRLAESIRQLDSIDDLSGMLRQHLQRAMHAESVYVLYREKDRLETRLNDAGDVPTIELETADYAGLFSVLEMHPEAQDWNSIRPHCSGMEARRLDAAGAQLIVPIAGHRVLGAILLGARKSEEPYTRKDRELLGAVAAQIGFLLENFSLRERVNRDRMTQRNVLARLGPMAVSLVKECPVCGTCYDSSDSHCARDGQELALTLPVERVIDGKYRMERLLGRGGMGAVYQARDIRLDRLVAVKVMTGSLFGNTAATRRFAREARAAARLDHPNIVRVHDFGEIEGGGAYLVMELVTGLTWRKRLRIDTAIPPSSAAVLLEQLFSGVEAAHHASVVHRDLKPDNLLIADGVVKILDFGLAKLREMEVTASTNLTVAGNVMGTYGYMSPEQLLGEEVDERTDVYALGVIALESLTGELRLRARGFHEQIDLALVERFGFADSAPEHRDIARALSNALVPARARRLSSVAALGSELLPPLRRCPPFPKAMARRAAGAEAGTTGYE